MMEKRYGILIANQAYPDDCGFASLCCPANDVAALKDVLMDPQHGEFTDVRILQDETRRNVLLALEEALQTAGRDDLVFIYFSGHGKLDRKGNLFFAACNTKADQLRATGINASDIKEIILDSTVRKKALVLDCCYAGAFASNWKSGANQVQDRVNEFSHGSGTYVLMATDELSLAEEDPKAGISVFTRHLVDGLRGKADFNRDGVITLTDLSNYVHEKVVDNHHQRPIEAGIAKRDEIAISKSGLGMNPGKTRRIRETLMKWSAADSITDTVLGEALTLLSKLSEGQCVDEDRGRRNLLDEIDQSGLGSGPFLTRWLQIDAMDNARRVKPPPPPEPPAAPAQQAVTPAPEPARQVEQPAPPQAPQTAPPAPPRQHGFFTALLAVILGVACNAAAVFMVAETFRLSQDFAWIVAIAGFIVAWYLLRLSRWSRLRRGLTTSGLLKLGALASLAYAGFMIAISFDLIR